MPNIFIRRFDTTNTYAIERNAVALGHTTAAGAWNAAVNYNYERNHNGKIFDNVGWVRGTKLAHGEWGAYLWTMQNRIAFKSSATNIWVSSNGISVAISNVFVGSLGVYGPMSNVVDIGPDISPATNFPGEGQSSAGTYYVDITNVYYQLIIPNIWITPRSAVACVGGSNVQYTVTGTNIPQGVTWKIIPEGVSATIQTNADWHSAEVTPGNVGTNYKVRATSVDNTNFYDQVDLTVVELLFLDASQNETNALKVGKWENGFNTGPTVKDNFIDLDPDRFYVRVNDQSKKGSGKVSVKLSTDSAGTDYDDDATEIELSEEPANSGIFISTNMLVVLDDVDDDFTNPNVVSDDTKNDRTHKVALGGKVKVQYPKTGTVICEKEANVPPSLKTVNVNIVILRDKPAATGGVPVIAVATVSNFWKIAQERYAQVGVNIQWTGPTVEDPPTNIDLSDGLLVRPTASSTNLAEEARNLIGALGTTNTTTDIHVFYVNSLWAGDGEIGGSAVAQCYYGTPSDYNYTYNLFLNGDTYSPWGGYAVAHELTHLTTDTGHPTSDTWRLMHGGVLTTTGATGSRRLTTTEESTIRGNSHVY